MSKPSLNHALAPVPAWWQNSVEAVHAYLTQRVKIGRVERLSQSPGGRDVHWVEYGQDDAQKPAGRCNWNSAMGAEEPDAYFGFPAGSRARPALMVIAGIHGGEVEGITGALSLVSVMETGVDLQGRPQEQLQQIMKQLHVMIVVLANPDGRARCPFDGWIGRTLEDMRIYAQGTRRSGELYGWPGCKMVHPMQGDVGILGSYFDDAGINMMHDFWESPRSATTAALLKRIAGHGPDFLLNLHSCENAPMVLNTAYLPPAVEKNIRRFNDVYSDRLVDAGMPASVMGAAPGGGDREDKPPAFNLTSMMYHVGAQMPVTFESPHGLQGWPFSGDYGQLLEIHHTLFAAAGQWVLDHRKA